jgi:hypothetical protein
MVWAIVFAGAFAAIFFAIGLLIEVLPANSRIRIAIDQIRNKLAARSLAKLQKRIASLKNYRDSLVTDKAQYLSTLRFILAILTFMALGISILIVGHIELFGRSLVSPGSFDLLALMCFGIAVFVAFYAVRIASLDTQDKIKAMLASIDADIQKLTSKLPPTNSTV